MAELATAWLLVEAGLGLHGRMVQENLLGWGSGSNSIRIYVFRRLGGASLAHQVRLGLAELWPMVRVDLLLSRVQISRVIVG